jgi:hypothetical protein
VVIRLVLGKRVNIQFEVRCERNFFTYADFFLGARNGIPNISNNLRA